MRRQRPHASRPTAIARRTRELVLEVKHGEDEAQKLAHGDRERACEGRREACERGGWRFVGGPRAERGDGRAPSHLSTCTLRGCRCTCRWAAGRAGMRTLRRCAVRWTAHALRDHVEQDEDPHGGHREVRVGPRHDPRRRLRPKLEVRRQIAGKRVARSGQPPAPTDPLRARRTHLAPRAK